MEGAMRGIGGIDPGWGITAVRVAMASVFIVAGYKKWFITGMPNVAASFAKSGLPAPGVMAYCIATLELVGGVLLLFGLFGRWLGVLYVAEFIVAAFWVKFPTLGWEPGRIDLMLLAGAIMLVLAGPGRAALDEWWLEKR
jgi:putative oxidoreductase